MWMSKTKIVKGLVLMALLLVVGCSKVTQANYDKIETGMTEDQVEAILGEGTESTSVGAVIGDLAGSARILTWGNEDKSITVTFANGKVVAKNQKGL